MLIYLQLAQPYRYGNQLTAENLSNDRENFKTGTISLFRIRSPISWCDCANPRDLTFLSYCMRVAVTFDRKRVSRKTTCKSCDVIEDEGHFILFCHTNKKKLISRRILKLFVRNSETWLKMNRLIIYVYSITKTEEYWHGSEIFCITHSCFATTF